MEKKHRIFISFKVSEKAKNTILQFQKWLKLANNTIKIKWYDSHLFHITLAFLGDLNESQIDEIKSELQSLVARQKQISMQLSELSGFPNLNNPASIVIKITEQGDIGKLFQLNLVRRLKSISLIKNIENWVPHITIGRNKNREKINWPKEMKISGECWQINSVEIMESFLNPNGPEYKELESFNFKQ
jgi:2'-5' RNA ligase